MPLLKWLDPNLVRRLLIDDDYTVQQLIEHLNTIYPDKSPFSRPTVEKFMQENEIRCRRGKKFNLSKWLDPNLVKQLIDDGYKVPELIEHLNTIYPEKSPFAKRSVETFMRENDIRCTQGRKSKRLKQKPLPWLDPNLVKQLIGDGYTLMQLIEHLNSIFPDKSPLARTTLQRFIEQNDIAFRKLRKRHPDPKNKLQKQTTLSWLDPNLVKQLLIDEGYALMQLIEHLNSIYPDKSPIAKTTVQRFIQQNDIPFGGPKNKLQKQTTLSWLDPNLVKQLIDEGYTLMQLIEHLNSIYPDKSPFARTTLQRFIQKNDIRLGGPKNQSIDDDDDDDDVSLTQSSSSNNDRSLFHTHVKENLDAILEETGNNSYSLRRRTTVNYDESSKYFEEEDTNKPVNEEDTNIPVDEEDTNKSMDEKDTSKPVDEEDTNIPVNEEDTNKPTNLDCIYRSIDDDDDDDVSLTQSSSSNNDRSLFHTHVKENLDAMLEETGNNSYALRRRTTVNYDELKDFEEEDTNVPVNEEDTNIPVDEEDTNKPMDEKDTSKPVDEEDTDIPVNEEDTNKPTNLDCISPPEMSKMLESASTGTARVMVFRPTMEEFKDFAKYINSIEKAGAQLECGIAKIIPPKEWHPRPSRGDDYSDTDSYMIDSPIKEHIHGSQGCYTKYNTVYKKEMSVAEYRKLAMSAEYSPPHYDDVHDMERTYWRNVTFRKPIYGADTAGTVSDRDVKEWNCNHLGTILDLIEQDTKIQIKGVNTAYLYFGMWKTTFPWHTEDMDLYSINYLHFGADKFWYGIADKDSDRFERLAETFFPQSARECKAFTRHKMHMISPSILKKHNIPYGTMSQRAGEFIITFPRGYHAGFNTGYNCAESTNFASDRWIDYGKNAVLCSCTNDTVKIDMTPFMKKYRPKEFEKWYEYWYGNRTVTTTEGEKKKGSRAKRHPVRDPDKEMKTKRRKKGGRDGSTEVFERPPRSPSPTTTGGKSKPKNNEQWKKPLDRLWQYKIPCFQAEREYNAAIALEEPHCAICQYFVSKSITQTRGTIPKRSRKLVSQLCFTRDPTTPLGFLDAQTSASDSTKEDRLLTCTECLVTVHAECYGVSENCTEKKWRCNRCTDFAKETAECQMCQLRGGALQPASGYGFAHVICALFNSLAHFVDPVKKQPIRIDPPAERIDDSEGFPCVFCTSDIGYTIACANCVGSPDCFHATCGRFAGVSFEFKDWPVLMSAVCAKHNWGPNADRLIPIEEEEPVVAWLEQGIRVRRGIVKSIHEETFCVVDFDDGSSSSDMYPSDITECSCSKQGCKGAHISGAHVTVCWPDGSVYKGTYRRAHTGLIYTVYLPNDNENVQCSREELYAEGEVVPDMVMQKLTSPKP